MAADERLRVAAVQLEHSKDPLDAVVTGIRDAADRDARLVLLPEYALATGDDPGPVPEALMGPVLDAAADEGVALGVHDFEHVPVRGEEELRSVVRVVDGGKVLLRQEKRRPTSVELDHGVAPGQGVEMGTLDGYTIAALVCADVLHPELAVEVRGAEVLLAPVMSRARFGDRTLFARRWLFVARSFDTGALVVKASGFTRGGRIAGRSLIAAPWGIVAQAPRTFEPAVITADVEREGLARVRATFKEARNE